MASNASLRHPCLKCLLISPPIGVCLTEGKAAALDVSIQDLGCRPMSASLSTCELWTNERMKDTHCGWTQNRFYSLTVGRTGSSILFRDKLNIIVSEHNVFFFVILLKWFSSSLVSLHWHVWKSCYMLVLSLCSMLCFKFCCTSRNNSNISHVPTPS